MITSRILKGGALLRDTRIVVEAWDDQATGAENLSRLFQENLLVKPSTARAHDVLHSVIRPRFVDPGPHVIPALRELLSHPSAFREACYYEAARADDLLSSFAEGPLYDWFQKGRVGISLAEVKAWIDDLMLVAHVPSWSERVRTRAANGLLSTLRDFGVLQGAVRKEIAPPSLSPAGFAYVAFRLHESGIGPRGLTSSHVWRRWLLVPQEVDQLFAEVAHHGVLRHSRAGSVVRVDWEMPSLVEVARAVA